MSNTLIIFNKEGIFRKLPNINSVLKLLLFSCQKVLPQRVEELYQQKCDIKILKKIQNIYRN